MDMRSKNEKNKSVTSAFPSTFKEYTVGEIERLLVPTKNWLDWLASRRASSPAHNNVRLLFAFLRGGKKTEFNT